MDEKEYNAIVEHYSALEAKKEAIESEIINTDDVTKKKLESELGSINEKLNLRVIEERQREARHALGRYTLEEASLIIQQSTGEWPSELQNKFKAAVLSGALPVYAPGKQTRYLYGNNFANCARVFYEEAYWNDLNEWLENNEPRLEYKFPKPDALATKSKAVPVVTPAQVTQNKLRRNSLDPAIDEAIKQAASVELAAVYLKLKAMALNEVKPFTGVLNGDALCYTDDKNELAKLTKDALGKRLKRRQTPLAAVSGR